ncbi:hypothetical protein [Bradyrhizobium sp. WSM2793]|uniref:hypothetical protein n=1 Tax=Bradyrhizobium sp. WSM2793 TaxID=1038866 RepID=UPI0003664D27|nr:hypothetical protein [Bradyrhizobium sp. WSM2793]
MTHKTDRFFRNLWRFNAIALAGATVLFIMLVLFVTASMLYDQTRPRQVTNVVNVGAQETVSNEFALGIPGVISGTPYVLVSLIRGQSYGGSGSLYPKRSDRNVVNLLFLNVSTNETRWLFEGAGQLIIENHSMFNRMKTGPDDGRTAVGFFYVVVDKDTDGDKRLSEHDALSLAVTAVDGTGYRKLIDGIEQVYAVQQVAEDKALVLYLKDKHTVSQLFSLPGMQPLKQTTIPKVGLN